MGRFTEREKLAIEALASKGRHKKPANWTAAACRAFKFKGQGFSRELLAWPFNLGRPSG